MGVVSLHSNGTLAKTSALHILTPARNTGTQPKPALSFWTSVSQLAVQGVPLSFQIAPLPEPHTYLTERLWVWPLPLIYNESQERRDREERRGLVGPSVLETGTLCVLHHSAPHSLLFHYYSHIHLGDALATSHVHSKPRHLYQKVPCPRASASNIQVVHFFCFRFDPGRVHHSVSCLPAVENAVATSTRALLLCPFIPGFVFLHSFNMIYSFLCLLTRSKIRG